MPRLGGRIAAGLLLRHGLGLLDRHRLGSLGRLVGHGGLLLGRHLARDRPPRDGDAHVRVDLELDALVVHPGDLPVDAPGRDDLVTDVDRAEHLLVALGLLPLGPDQQHVHEDEQHEEEDENRIH